MARRSPPSANIYWRDIPANACVKDTGTMFVVISNSTLPIPMARKAKRAVAYWEGREGAEAQRALIARAKKPCKLRRRR